LFAPKILHNLCFPFLLGITVVPRETEDNAYAKLEGQTRCIMGDVEMANFLKYSKEHATQKVARIKGQRKKKKGKGQQTKLRTVNGKKKKVQIWAYAHARN